jgi:predicted O-methyltransferase YrrM
MYSKLQLALKYVAYNLAASNSKGHGIHSPFVFDFVTNVLNDGKPYSDYEKVESLRKKLLRNKSVLTIEDYGAGSGSSSSGRRTVSAIARHALKPKKYAQLIYRIARYYQPSSLIELGTSLGVTSSYLSLARPDAPLVTLEGASAIAGIARQNFADLGLTNVNIVEGNFDYTLPSVLYCTPVVEFAFIDGNHRRQPTENYFQWLLGKSTSNTIFIFDDIHWSVDMEQAWKMISAHDRVRCSIDLFFIGIVFFRNEFKEKQHFTVKF